MPLVFNEALAAQFPWQVYGANGREIFQWPDDAVTAYLRGPTPSELRPVHRHVKKDDHDKVLITLFPPDKKHTCLNLLELRFANPRHRPVHELIKSIDLTVGGQRFDLVFAGPHLESLLEYHGRGSIVTCDNGVTRVPLPLLSTHARDLLPNLCFHDIDLGVYFQPGQKLQDVEVWAWCYDDVNVPHTTSGEAWFPVMRYTSLQSDVLLSSLCSTPLTPGTKAIDAIIMWGIPQRHIDKIEVTIGDEILATWTPDPPFYRGGTSTHRPDTSDPHVRTAMECLDKLLPADIVIGILHEAFVNTPVIISFPKKVNPNRSDPKVSLQLVKSNSSTPYKELGIAYIGRNVPHFVGGVGGLEFGS